jgi:hypothetical protein
MRFDSAKVVTYLNGIVITPTEKPGPEAYEDGSFYVFIDGVSVSRAAYDLIVSKRRDDLRVEMVCAEIYNDELVWLDYPLLIIHPSFVMLSGFSNYKVVDDNELPEWAKAEVDEFMDGVVIDPEEDDAAWLERLMDSFEG